MIHKSEKARRKLAQETWQHSMLGKNLVALRLAQGLMRNEPLTATRDDLRNARDALFSMIKKSEEFLPKFSTGTPQHTLQQNRLAALHAAAAGIVAESDRLEPPENSRRPA